MASHPKLTPHNISEFALASSKLDAWKYTHLSRYALESFTHPLPIPTLKINDKLEPYKIEPASQNQFVFYNGKLISAPNNTPLQYVSEGLIVPKNTILPKPVYIFYITETEQKSGMDHLRTPIVLEENSQAHLVERYINLGNAPAFVNAVTEINLHQNTRLQHIRLQQGYKDNLHVSQLNLIQAKQSNYMGTAVLIGGKLNRLGIAVSLNEKEASCKIRTLQWGQQTEHLDTYLNIEHHAPECESDTISRGIANHKARCSFTGKIVVPEKAYQSKACLENKNLLLSGDAEINTRPQLEIYNNDVVCTHGATVGALDCDALFYLQTRGIPEKTAKQLMIQAFLSPALQNIPEGPLLAYLEDLLYA